MIIFGVIYETKCLKCLKRFGYSNESIVIFDIKYNDINAKASDELNFMKTGCIGT
jgi:hypothetical protein